MTKQDYIDLKVYYKELVSKRKDEKRFNKQLQSEYSKQLNKYLQDNSIQRYSNKYWDTVWQFNKELTKKLQTVNNYYFEVRSIHIFLSLCRGKTREQIELKTRDNFHTVMIIENKLKELCEKYTLEYDCDLIPTHINELTLEHFKQYNKIIGIKRHWIYIKGAA